MIKGTVKCDGIAVGEGSFNYLTPSVQLKVKAAFVNSTTGKTHGWTETSTGWSKETFLKLEELRLQIEKDLAVLHFSDSEEVLLNSSTQSRSSDVPSGLGEHLEELDAPQF